MRLGGHEVPCAGTAFKLTPAGTLTTVCNFDFNSPDLFDPIMGPVLGALGPRFAIFMDPWDTLTMKREAIRTTVDIPVSLYRQLKQQAAAQGRSVRDLILLGARTSLLQARRPRAKKVQFPLIQSEGPKVDLTNEQIYERVEFP